MSVGGTPVGSIVGFLRMDADQFHREAERVMAEVEAIEHSDPTVKIKADTAGAQAKVTTFAAATTRSMAGVDHATRGVEDATARVGVAEAKLSEARSAALPKASRVLAAENDLRRARRAEQDAIFATYSGNIKLDKSMEDVARTAGNAAKSADAFGSSIGGIPAPAIVGGIAAAFALIGPVAGAATAGAAAFGAAAGVSALALAGLRREMQQGTAVGNALSGELGSLKTDLHGLEAAAASGMSNGVLASLNELHGTLPFLRDEVHGLGVDLGRAFHTTTGGLLSGLHAANPLLQDAGMYANVLADKFAHFMESQDFTDFIDYSRRELPQVAAALESVGTAVVDVSKALAPVGDGLIKSTNGLGKLADAWSHTMKYTTGIGLLSEGLKALGGSGQDAAAGALDHAAAATDQNAVLAAQNPLLAAQASALGTTVSALQQAATAQGQTAATAANATLQLQLENDAAGLLKQSLDLLNGKALDAASAQNAFDSSLVNMGTHVGTTGKKITFTTTSIHDMSAASVALRGQLNDQVQNLERVVEANGGLANSTGKARAQMATMRQQIINNAVAHGVDRKAVTAYVDSLLKIPKSIPPTKLQVDTAAATAKIKAFQTLLSNLHSVHMTVSASVLQGTLNKQKPSANGNIFRAFAGGGFEDHVAQIAPAGANRLWAEPETGGEAYIPLAPSKRSRSMAIWEETGRMLGAGGAGGPVDLSDESLRALASAIGNRPVVARVPAGSLERAVMAGVR